MMFWKLSIFTFIFVACADEAVVNEEPICTEKCVVITNMLTHDLQLRINSKPAFKLSMGDSIQLNKSDTLYHYVNDTTNYAMKDTTFANGITSIKIFLELSFRLGHGTGIRNKFITSDSTFCRKRNFPEYKADYKAYLPLDKKRWENDDVFQTYEKGVVREEMGDSVFTYEIVETCPQDTVFDAYSRFGEIAWVVKCNPRSNFEIKAYLSGMGLVSNIEENGKGWQGYRMLRLTMVNGYIFDFHGEQFSQKTFTHDDWDYGCTGY